MDRGNSDRPPEKKFIIGSGDNFSPNSSKNARQTGTVKRTKKVEPNQDFSGVIEELCSKFYKSIGFPNPQINNNTGTLSKDFSPDSIEKNNLFDQKTAGNKRFKDTLIKNQGVIRNTNYGFSKLPKTYKDIKCPNNPNAGASINNCSSDQHRLSDSTFSSDTSDDSYNSDDSDIAKMRPYVYKHFIIEETTEKYVPIKDKELRKKYTYTVGLPKPPQVNVVGKSSEVLTENVITVPTKNMTTDPPEDIMILNDPKEDKMTSDCSTKNQSEGAVADVGKSKKNTVVGAAYTGRSKKNTGGAAAESREKAGLTKPKVVNAPADPFLARRKRVFGAADAGRSKENTVVAAADTGRSKENTGGAAAESREKAGLTKPKVVNAPADPFLARRKRVFGAADAGRSKENTVVAAADTGRSKENTGGAAAESREKAGLTKQKVVNAPSDAFLARRKRKRDRK